MAFAMGWVQLAGMAASALANYAGQQSANKANEMHSIESNNWTKMMSDSAHQREVTDLKAAGLNPILSANAGASSPTGAQSTDQNAGASLAASAKDMVLFKQQQEMQNQEITKSKQDVETGKATEKLQNALKSKADKEAAVLSYDAKASKIKESLLDSITSTAKDGIIKDKIMNKNEIDRQIKHNREIENLRTQPLNYLKGKS